jgi:hypothetical protein
MEKHRLIIFEKNVLRRIFGPKTENVTYCLNPLQNPVLHNLQSKRMEWAGHAAGN